jgi:hypothetical protein
MQGVHLLHECPNQLPCVKFLLFIKLLTFADFFKEEFETQGSKKKIMLRCILRSQSSSQNILIIYEIYDKYPEGILVINYPSLVYFAKRFVKMRLLQRNF